MRWGWPSGYWQSKRYLLSLGNPIKDRLFEKCEFFDQFSLYGRWEFFKEFVVPAGKDSEEMDDVITERRQYTTPPFDGILPQGGGGDNDIRKFEEEVSDTMGVIETMTPQEATEVLRNHGMRMSPDTLRYGLEQGLYPFGICIQCDKQPVYQIFRRLFYEWIAEREVQT